MNGQGEKDLLFKPSERSAVDINIARYPIFASKAVRGYRVLPSRVDLVEGKKITRTVSVGTYRDTNKTLDTDDELVFKAIYGRWARNGCDMNNRNLASSLISTGHLLAGPGAKKRRLGQRDYNKLRACLDKLAHIGIAFDQAYENNMGWSTEQITLLKKVKLFNRKDSLESGGKFFEFSELELNETVCQSIKAGNIKLFYLDQIYSIRGETGRLIYDRLELLGGVIESPFRRNALDFAKECTIDIGPNGRPLKPTRVIEKMRYACKELTGKMLTFGVIGDCFIDSKAGTGHTLKWFFVCHINKVLTTRPKKTKEGSVHIVPDRKDLEIAVEIAKEKELSDLYEDLSAAEKSKIDARSEEIKRTKFNGLGTGTFAKEEALREYFGLQSLRDEVKDLVARETGRVSYIGNSQRAAIAELATALSRYCDLKRLVP